MSLFKKEGNQIQFRDTGQAVRLFIVEQFGFTHYLDGEILKFIDALANNGANGFRVFGLFPFGLGREQEPYIRSGNDFDLTRFNDAYYTYLRQWVEYAQKRGVAVLYELFDSVGVKYSQLGNYHPFGRFFKHEGNAERRLNLFTTLGGQVERYQKEYVSYTVNILKQYPHVIFGIMNEFKGNAKWHYEMSKFVRSLAPQHLISGSDDSSPGTDDRNVDIWAIHTGAYDFTRCQSNINQDVKNFRPKIGSKILTYSTDGFGTRGQKCETASAMGALARDVKNNSITIFRFLDQKPYVSRDDAGNEYPSGAWVNNSQAYETSQAKRANTSAYRAIADVFQPTPLSQAHTKIELPEGILYVFKALYLESLHPKVIEEQGGKGVLATTTKGYLGLSPIIGAYQGKPLPETPLDVYFSVFIDNNTYDDAVILILDVYDTAAKQVLTNWAITRKQFPKAQAFNLLKLSITPSSTSHLELRVYYFGFAHVILDKIALVRPDQLQKPIMDASDLPDVHTPVSAEESSEKETPQEEPEEKPTVEDQDGILGLFLVAHLPHTHPEAFADKGGKAIKATTREGFLAYGPYIEGLPSKALDVYFSLHVDNNTAENRHLLTLDVYDSLNQKILAEKQITRQQFPVAGKFVFFKLSFTPPAQSRLEFRILYKGYSYVAADKIVVADPQKITLRSPADIPSSVSPTTPGQPDGSSPTPDTSGACTGSEILCLAQCTEELVRQQGGKDYGGTFQNGRYTPSNRGGIGFEKTIDTSRKFMIELELDGNIANVHRTGENDGGKVSLFDIKEQGGSYYLGLQRMHKEYRGGGLFRFILTNNYGSTEGAAWLITASGLAGNYSTFDWRDEPHKIQIIIAGNTCHLRIDDRYQSRAVTCSGHISGVKRVEILLGNRLDRMANQQAITNFKRFKIVYL